jgi:hypothetical protein
VSCHDRRRLVAGGFAQRSHEFLRLPGSLLESGKRLLACTLIVEGFHVMIVVKRDEARSQSNHDRPKQHDCLLVHFWR